MLAHPLITVQGQTFRPDAWLHTHGGYDEATGTIRHGVEFVHLETGFQAAKLVVTKAPPERTPTLQAALFEGIGQCRQMLDEFFINSRLECEAVLTSQLSPEMRTQAAKRITSRASASPATRAP